MDLTPKSRLVSFGLTFFLGPLGLLYSSVTWAVILLVVTWLTLGTIIIPIACYLASWGIGDHYVHRHNQNIDMIKQLAQK